MRNLYVLIFVLFSNLLVGGTEIHCKTRYYYKKYHKPIPPAYSETQTLGRHPIAGTGRKGYYENKWSNTYSLNVKFYSGYELNKFYNSSSYNNNSIVAIVSWTNGGQSFIVMKRWFTNLKVMTENEIKFNTNGERVRKMTGYDSKNRLWEFYY